MLRLRFIASRAVWALFVVLSVSTLVFVVVRAVPGDPVESILGEHATDVDRQVLAECLRLNDSLARQYAGFLGDIADGTLGHFCDDPSVTVAQRLVEALPYTLELGLASVALAWLIALPLGVLAALKRGTWVDISALMVALIGISIPDFWLGPMLLLLFAVFLQLVPDPGSGVVDLTALLLPTLTLGTALAAKLARMTRSALLEVLSSDYVRTARAKGLRERRVILKHALRNAMLPLVTVTGLQLGAVLSGTIIVETVFARPGLGSLLMDAIQQRNYMLVQGCVLVISFSYVAINFLTDVAYVAVDPRVELEARP